MLTNDKSIFADQIEIDYKLQKYSEEVEKIYLGKILEECKEYKSGL